MIPISVFDDDIKIHWNSNPEELISFAKRLVESRSLTMTKLKLCLLGPTP